MIFNPCNRRPDDVCETCGKQREEHTLYPLSNGIPIERCHTGDFQFWWAFEPASSQQPTTEDECMCGDSIVKGVAPVVEGVGKDAPIIQNASGGRQSHSPYRCDLLPPLATLAVAQVLAHGADKYGANNWHSIDVADHLNHAIVHLFAFLAGDTSDDHLEHFACRALMALDQQLSGRDKPKEPYCMFCRDGFPCRAGGQCRKTWKPKEDRRKRVYLAGPISKGNLADNVRRASVAFKELAESGVAPWCPQWSIFSHPSPERTVDVSLANSDTPVIGWGSAMGNGMSHADWLAVDLAWVATADAILRLPGESVGADRETAEAERLGIPVFHSIPEVLEWSQGA